MFRKLALLSLVVALAAGQNANPQQAAAKKAAVKGAQTGLSIAKQVIIVSRGKHVPVKGPHNPTDSPRLTPMRHTGRQQQAAGGCPQGPGDARHARHARGPQGPWGTCGTCGTCGPRRARRRQQAGGGGWRPPHQRDGERERPERAYVACAYVVA